MMGRSLFEEFKHFRGQEVEIFTDDGRKICGIDVEVNEDSVRVVDKCGRLILLEFRHIDAVVEPRMKLRPCCHKMCECEEEEEERECGCRDWDDEDFGRSRRREREKERKRDWD